MEGKGNANPVTVQASAAIVIPARLRSTRMNRKLLRNETGRPLVAYAAEAGCRAREASDGRIGPVVVATDSKEVADALREDAREYGYDIEATLTRTDHASGTDRIAEAAHTLPSTIRFVLNLQGDEPETPPAYLLTLLDLLENGADASMSTLVRPAATGEMANPNRVKAVLAADGRCLYFSRAPVPHDRGGTPPQVVPPGYVHLGLYGYRRTVLAGYADLPDSILEQRERLEQLRALEAGLIIKAAIVDKTPPGIDTEEDYTGFVERIRKGVEMERGNC